METTLQEFEPDTVGTLLAHLTALPADMPVTDGLGEWAVFRVVEDTETGERCLEVN